MSESLSLLILRVTNVLEHLHVPYLIGGSIASMMHGVVRTTLDADIIADLSDDQVEAFVNVLTDEYYVDADSIHDAIKRRRCFNIIHLATMFKIDIFIPCWDGYLREEFKRRTDDVGVTAWTEGVYRHYRGYDFSQACLVSFGRTCFRTSAARCL